MRLRFLNLSPGISVFLVIVVSLSIAMIISLAVSSLISKPVLSGDVLKYFDKGFLVKAFDYNQRSLIISVVSRFIQWAYFVVVIFIIYRFFSNTTLKSMAVIGYIALFFVLMYIVLLPLSYYRGFVMEQAYGLSTQSAASWFFDHLKSVLVNIGIYTLVLGILYILLRFTPRYWYIIAFAVFIVFLVIMIVVYPLLIDPLFYNFKPLEDQDLKKRIEEVTQKAGIEVDNILVADASRRTTRANAYFTGLGFSKRIVLYDNLVDRFSDDEIINVVAHEAGHWKRLHIAKSLLFGIMGGAVLIGLTKLIVDRYSSSNNLLLILIIFVFFTFATFLTQPVQNAISRHFERNADILTIKYTGDPDTQVKLFKNLAILNLSNVRPNSYIKYLLYSHPPIMERIDSISSLK